MPRLYVSVGTAAGSNMTATRNRLQRLLATRLANIPRTGRRRQYLSGRGSSSHKRSHTRGERIRVILPYVSQEQRQRTAATGRLFADREFGSGRCRTNGRMPQMRCKRNVWPRTRLEASDGHVPGMRDVDALDGGRCEGVARGSYRSTRSTRRADAQIRGLGVALVRVRHTNGADCIGSKRREPTHCGQSHFPIANVGTVTRSPRRHAVQIPSGSSASVPSRS